MKTLGKPGKPNTFLVERFMKTLGKPTEHTNDVNEYVYSGPDGKKVYLGKKGQRVSRQRWYQIKHEKEGLCTLCPEPAYKLNLCEKCYDANKDKRRTAARNWYHALPQKKRRKVNEKRAMWAKDNEFSLKKKRILKSFNEKSEAQKETFIEKLLVHYSVLNELQEEVEKHLKRTGEKYVDDRNCTVH